MSDDKSENAPSAPDRRRTPRREEDQRLVQRDRELEAARRVCQALSHEINSDRLIEQALRTALDVVEAEAGSVLLADPKSKQLIFRHVVGEKAELLRGMAFPWDKGLAGAVFASGHAEVIADARQDRRHYPNVDALTGFQTRDMIVLPLKQWGKEPIGVLEVMNKRHGRLDQQDVAILTIISALSTLVIEQVRLFEEAKLAAVVHRLGGLGHDVNNMLVPIVTGTKIVQAELDRIIGDLPEAEAKKAQASQNLCKETLSIVKDATGRIRDRMKEVSDCVKGLSAQPHFAPCHVADVVGNVVKLLGFVAEKNGITLRTEGLAILPPIMADERLLYRAFYNLVNNAIPEVPSGGSVTVLGRMDPGGDAVLLSVADTGGGMPPSIRDSLFSAHVISVKAGGTGLGTRIVKDVVDAHGGHITVESQEGVGTVFHIRLPLQLPPGPHA
jgi:signal transduction histidine kinase